MFTGTGKIDGPIVYRYMHVFVNSVLKLLLFRSNVCCIRLYLSFAYCSNLYVKQGFIDY